MDWQLRVGRKAGVSAESFTRIMGAHEGHALTVEREFDEQMGMGIMYLRCVDTSCSDTAVARFDFDVPTMKLALDIEVAAWDRGELPDATSVALDIAQALHKDYHDPNVGEWWLVS